MVLIPCPLCEKIFANNQSLATHIRTSHAGQYYRLKCKERNCMQVFKNLKSFLYHIQSNHSNLRFLTGSSSITLDTPISNTNVTVNHVQERNYEEVFSYELDLVATPYSANINLYNNNSNKKNSYIDEVLHETNILIAGLYAKSTLPMNCILSIIKLFEEFYNLNFVKKLESICNRNGNIDSINNVIMLMKNVLHNFKSEHRTLQDMKKLYYVEPKVIHVATLLQSKRYSKLKRFIQVKITVVIVPLREVLQKFLELSNVFHTIMKYIYKMEESQCFYSIFQSERWLQIKRKNVGKIVMPLTFYGDDFQVNNPLGSHKNINKMHALYCKIAAIPPEYISLLENIFFSSVISI